MVGGPHAAKPTYSASKTAAYWGERRLFTGGIGGVSHRQVVRQFGWRVARAAVDLDADRRAAGCRRGNRLEVRAEHHLNDLTVAGNPGNLRIGERRCDRRGRLLVAGGEEYGRPVQRTRVVIGRHDVEPAPLELGGSDCRKT